jgi:hypothetical protein
MTPPSLACAQNILHVSPEDPAEDQEEQRRRGDDHDREARMRGHIAEVQVERAGDAQEHVQVDEGASEGEEDLLHQVRRDRAPDRTTGDDRDEHQQGDERADVRGEKAVHRDTHRVRCDHRPELDFLPIGRFQDPVVRKAREEGLARLEYERCRRVPTRHRLDLVPKLHDPAPDADPEQLQHQPEKRQPSEPERDLDDPAAAGGTLDGESHAAHNARGIVTPPGLTSE